MDVVSVGETMVTFVPDKVGRLRAAERFHKFAGGAETNTLIGLQRLGYLTRWISLLGNDEFGKFVLSRTRGEGIDVSSVSLIPQVKTGLLFLERNMIEDCRSVYYRNDSAYQRLSPEYIDESMLKDTKILYLTGITPVLNSSCLAATVKVMELAREKGIKVVFDPNVRLKLVDIPRARSLLIPLLKKSNIVMPNLGELQLLFPEKSLSEIAEQLLNSDVEILVVKKGKRGAIAYTKDLSREAKAYQLPKLASSIGAGDAFNAGFIAGLLDQQGLESCLTMGTAMGALACMGFASYEMLPSRSELNNFLAGRAEIIR
ncbi:MAG: sugar kinase [Halanaerobiales bacterium]|nr:sugar kinase [Halanaerobiales bacterium]